MTSLTHRLLQGHPFAVSRPAIPRIETHPGGATTDERSLLDLVMPDYHFRGKVTVSVDATPEEIFRAVEEITLAEIPLARTIGALRSLPWRKRKANDRPSQRVIEATHPLRLGENPGREIVLGFAGKLHNPRDPELVDLPDLFTFTRFNDAAYQKLAMNICAVPEPGGTRTTLASEYRIVALSRASRRRFAVRWYLMAGWSGNLALRMQLRAVKRRAEADHRLASRSA